MVVSQKETNEEKRPIMKFKLMGIGDEAGDMLATQIQATQALSWTRIEMRNVQVGAEPQATIHDISDTAFDSLVRRLEAANIQVHCFGSPIMNWQKTPATPLCETMAEVQRAIPRMQRLGTKFVRIMSYKPDDSAFDTPAIVFEHVREVTKRFLDAGMQPVHENCMNHGGMSWVHTLQLLEKCPGLKLVFDTGNPIFNADRRGYRPWPKQNAWEFWTQVRDHVVHIHIKDAIWDQGAKKETYTWPGHGQGYVREIIADALSRGYDSGVSIEPHMVKVFHDAQTQASPTDTARLNFIEYGRELKSLIATVSTPKSTPTRQR